MSTTRTDFFYGWDLLYKTIEGVLKKKDDVLIALAHFMLTKHSQFRCIGIGEDKTFSEDEENSGSELLPDGWIGDDNNYALRYTNNKQLYLLLGLRAEGSLIVTLLNVKTRKVSNICLDPECLVNVMKGNLKIVIPTASELADRYQKELFEPVFDGTSKTVTTQTTDVTATSSDRSDDRLRIGPPRIPVHGFNVPHPAPFGLPVGEGDLDPLGRGGPGSLYPYPVAPDFNMIPHNNFRPVPRPRFDHFVPPERGIGQNPNPDHMQPPNFGGNYYM